MPPRIHLSDVKDLIGKEIGISKWITVDQTMIDRFAEATDDHQFIHTDPHAPLPKHPSAAPSRTASCRCRCSRR